MESYVQAKRSGRSGRGWHETRCRAVGCVLLSGERGEGPAAHGARTDGGFLAARLRVIHHQAWLRVEVTRDLPHDPLALFQQLTIGGIAGIRSGSQQTLG